MKAQKIPGATAMAKGEHYEKIIAVPKGYDRVTLLRENFSPVKAVAVSSKGDKRPIMLIGEDWEVVAHG